MTLVFDSGKLEVTYVDSGLKMVLDDANDRMKITTAAGLELLVDGQSNLVELGAEGAGDFVALDSKVQENFNRVRDEMDQLAAELRAHQHPLPMFFLVPGTLIECIKQPISDLVTGTNLVSGATANANHPVYKVDAPIEEQNPDPSILRGEAQIIPGTTPTATASATATLRD